MALLSSALAFDTVEQATSCTPGMDWKYDSRRWLCSAPSWRPTPPGPRITTGTCAPRAASARPRAGALPCLHGHAAGRAGWGRPGIGLQPEGRAAGKPQAEQASLVTDWRRACRDQARLGDHARPPRRLSGSATDELAERAGRRAAGPRWLAPTLAPAHKRGGARAAAPCTGRPRCSAACRRCWRSGCTRAAGSPCSCPR